MGGKKPQIEAKAMKSGAENRRLSKESKMPPLPGIKELESFTPTERLRALSTKVAHNNRDADAQSYEEHVNQ